MELRYENGVVGNSYSSIETTIRIEDIKKEGGLTRFMSLMRFYVDKFINELELNCADYLVEYAKENNIDIHNAIIIRHNNGAALCDVSYWCNKFEVKPFISLTSPSFASQWTFESGHFSDVDIMTGDSYTSNGFVWICTTDTLPEHNLLMHYVMKQVEDAFYSDIETPIYETNTNFYSNKIGFYNYKDVTSKYNEFASIVEYLTSINKSKRIDTIKIDGMTALDYIRTHQVFTMTSIMKMAITFGKPYSQIETFVKKNPYWAVA